MMSEKSDIGGKSPNSSGGEITRVLEAKTGQRGLSNAMIFLLFTTLLFVGTASVIVLAIAPTLTSLSVFVISVVFFSSGLLTLGYVLFQRISTSSLPSINLDQSHALLQSENLVQELKLTISKLKHKNMDLKCAYQEEHHRAQVAIRSKTAFLAHLSHDIRTPLNHIIGFADMVSHEAFGPLGDKRYLTYITDIKKSGENLLVSVADVLELADLESGQRALTSEEILVDDLLNTQITRFEARAKRCNISLELDSFCAAVLRGDRLGYERMLTNLIDNAFKFTQAGGKIRLAAWVASDGVVLEITDTGIGIHPSRLSRLLEPFSHQDALNSKERKGVGLGLAIARSITELSGGELAIDSSPGVGTTVAVSLPLAVATEEKLICTA